VSANPNCGLEFLPHTQARAKLQRLVQAVRTFRGSP
jgi:methionine synthase II (cobalamin-independent)